MKIMNITRATTIAERIVVAENIFSRMKGLLGRKSFENGEALIIKRCRAIHMFFMLFAIDVIFIDKNFSVVGIVEKIKPFQLSPIFWKANFAIELPEGVIQNTRISLGDKIRFED